MQGLFLRQPTFNDDSGRIPAIYFFTLAGCFWLVLTGSIVLTTGCGNQTLTGKNVPAPLLDEFPYEFTGVTGRRWGADNFEVIDGRTVHFVVLNDVMAPKRGHPFFGESMREIRQMTLNHEIITVEVLKRDELERELGYVRAKDQDFGLKLLETGLAVVNFQDIDPGQWTERQKQYSRAETQARQNKIGIWSQTIPIHPADSASD